MVCRVKFARVIGKIVRHASVDSIYYSAKIAGSVPYLSNRVSECLIEQRIAV